MTDIAEQKQKANQLRKAMAFGEALPLYRDLWKQTRDEFDGAGLLHCLRKLELFDEAVILADDLITKYPDFAWCRNEVIWTYIQGMLGKLSEEATLEKVVEIANRVMSLNPKGLAAKIVVFRVLRSAKSSRNWDTVNEWVGRIDPDSLGASPMTDESGSKGWSDQALWYNYRIRGLLEKADSEEQIGEAIKMADEVSERFPKQRKIFLRLSALGNHILGNLPASERVYQSLCSGYKPDWWLLHEYGKVVRDLGRGEDALKLMYQAASSHSKLTSMVTLFVDIAMLCKGMGKYEEARAHLVLCKYVREEQG